MSLLDDSLAPRTRYDWNFHIGDIAVRVHPYFWLVAVLLSLRPSQENPLGYLLAWVALLFGSILVHELGHVLMGRQFGSRGHIILTGMCGLAVGASNLNERWQRILVSLAGPGAGFVLGGLVALVSWLIDPQFTIMLLRSIVGLDHVPQLQSPMTDFVIRNLIYINLFWGLVNLLPIWPLDGGKICQELCEAKKGRDGMKLAIQISLFTAAGLALLELIEYIRIEHMKLPPLIPYVPLGASLFTILFFGILAFNSWRVLQFIQQGGLYAEEEQQSPRAPWERDADWWKKGDDDWRD